jgi:hypothetical protein
MSRKVIFNITDPQGRSVVFHDNTWKHIREGHSEITHYQRIKTTVMNPDFILHRSIRKSLIYVDCTQLSLYFSVFTKFDESLNECTISTAFLTRDFPNGDTIWQRSNQKNRKSKK